jgi:acylpyruvate hydrolase
LHHEVELGLVISETAKNLNPDNAMDHVKGYVLALDMTGRSMQNELKKAGLPWLLAKGFNTSCPISEFISKEQISDVGNLQLKLLVNNNLKQSGNTKDMIFNIPTILTFITKYITLEPNDIVLTGTPSGVSPVKSGDVIDAFLLENNKVLANISFPVIGNK